MNSWKLLGQFFRYIWDIYEYIYYRIYYKIPVPERREFGAGAIVFLLMSLLVGPTATLFNNCVERSTVDIIVLILFFVMAFPVSYYSTYHTGRALKKFKRLSVEKRKSYTRRAWILITCTVFWFILTIVIRIIFGIA